MKKAQYRGLSYSLKSTKDVTGIFSKVKWKKPNIEGYHINKFSNNC